MHNPCTQAFYIINPLSKNKNAIMTIWHKDPESDGSDDSCGWFIRARHCDKEELKKCRGDFSFNWCNSWGGWFNQDGNPHFSVQAITLDMFRIAAMHRLGNWRRADRFMKKHLVQLMLFAENTTDSMHPFITQRYGHTEREERIDEALQLVYPYVCRLVRPWYKHPRWHIHHWGIQFHPWQSLKRRFWDKCSICKKRGFSKGVYAMGDWSGTKVWHHTCDSSHSALKELTCKKN